MAIWIKPSGVEIEINDSPDNIEQATKLGWELKSLKEEEKKTEKTKKEKTKKEVK